MMTENSSIPDSRVVVKLLGKGGQGVWVPGGYILTAAHCIGWSSQGEMVLGDRFIEDIQTSDGQRFKMQPVVVEPVSDIAVLGPQDDVEFREDIKKYQAAVRSSPTIPLFQRKLKELESYKIWVFVPDKSWISGKATMWGPDGANAIWVETDDQIPDGASGGPIVDEHGMLLAIVSNFSEGSSNGLQPIPCRALPVWVLDKILAAEE